MKNFFLMVAAVFSRLVDDDTVMRTATKAGKQWLAVKRELIAAGKISLRESDDQPPCQQTGITVQRSSVEHLRSVAAARRAPAPDERWNRGAIHRRN